MTKVFMLENHTYYVRHLRDNFLRRVAKLDIKKHVLKDMPKEIFNRLAYVPTGA